MHITLLITLPCNLNQEPSVITAEAISQFRRNQAVMEKLKLPPKIPVMMDLPCSSSSNGILSDNSDNLTLRGTIVSSEYNQKDGVIANSVFGNWSLISKDDHSIDFKSSFTLRPIIYGYDDVYSPKTFNSDVVSPGISNNTVVSAGSQSDKTKNQYSNTTSYSLSNFNVYSVQTTKF